MADNDDERRQNAALRVRLDEIEKGYLARADANRNAILALGQRTQRLLVVLIVVLLSLGLWQLVLSFRQSDTLREVQHSRASATAVTCAVMSAVTDAGRHVLTASQLRESPFTRFLERHGYPPPDVRRAQAQASAVGYAALITSRVAKIVGAKRAADLIEADGTIDCAAFAKLVAVSVK